MVNRSQGNVSKGKRIRRKESLISHVVNGENGGYVAEGWIFGVLSVQQDRYEGGLPVVAMENLGHAKNFRCFQHGAGKQRETFGVVGIVAGGSAVECLAIEEWRIIDEVETHSRVLAATDDRTKAVTVVEGNGDAAHDGLGVL